MVRRIATKSGARRALATKAAGETISLDDRPLRVQVSRDQKRLIVTMPYEVWVLNAATLEVEKTIELPHVYPTVFETASDGVLWLGGTHLHRATLWSGAATKVGTKLGGFVDRVCLLRPRLLCGVGSQGEVLWDIEAEKVTHRRKSSSAGICGLGASPDGRAVWIDGSSHAWVLDPDHPSGYMKLKLKATSPAQVEEEGLVVLETTATGRTVFAARDGAVAWTNRALRIIAERHPAFDSGAKTTPLAAAGDNRYIYVLRPGGVIHRFLVEQPKIHPDAKEEPEALPELETARLKKRATCMAALDGQLFLAGPTTDDTLGRMWRQPANDLDWKPLRVREREMIEPPPAPPEPVKQVPNFTATKSKLQGPALGTIKVDDVLAANPPFWVTKSVGNVTERPVVGPDHQVLPGDALLFGAMFRFQEGTARPGLLLWPGVNDGRPLLDLVYLAWGDDPQAWTPLETPPLRKQGWRRSSVFPVKVALTTRPPNVPGNRVEIPDNWTDPELFDALTLECKKLLKVLW